MPGTIIVFFSIIEIFLDFNYLLINLKFEILTSQILYQCVKLCEFKDRKSLFSLPNFVFMSCVINFYKGLSPN